MKIHDQREAVFHLDGSITHEMSADKKVRIRVDKVVLHYTRSNTSGQLDDWSPSGPPAISGRRLLANGALSDKRFTDFLYREMPAFVLDLILKGGEAL